jgi:hypothetical protein
VTGFCADGVCCDRACDGVCERCDAPGTAGTCTPVKDAEDGPICTGAPRRCNAEGACVGCTVGPCEPAYAWTRTFPAASPSLSWTTDVAVGPDGTIVATGAWAGTVDFDPGPGVASRTSMADRSAYIMKFDAGGNVLWSRFLAGSNNISASLATVGLDGSVYVVGGFRGLMDLDPTEGIDQHDGGLDSADVYLIKLTADGKYVWGRTLPSGGPFELYNARTTPDGNIVINGAFESTLDLDPGSGTDQITTAAGKGFLLEISPAGERLWSRQVMLLNTNQIFELSVGRDGTVAYGGQFVGTVDLDPTAGVDMHASTGGMDAFVVALDAAGKFRWARTAGSAKDENGFAVVDGAGNVYLGGIASAPFRADPQGPELSPRGNAIGGFMIQYDRDGRYRWSHDLAGDNMIVPRRGVAVAPDGILVTGIYAGNANFDPVGTHLAPAVGLTWFFMRWTPDGQLGWVKTFGHTSSGSRPRLAALPWGGFVIGDAFNYNVDFDPGSGVDTRTSDIDDDAFVTAITR